jgi:hypothetical protein
MTLFKVSSGLVQLSNMTEINLREKNKHTFESIPYANKGTSTENNRVFATLLLFAALPNISNKHYITSVRFQ